MEIESPLKERGIRLIRIKVLPISIARTWMASKDTPIERTAAGTAIDKAKAANIPWENRLLQS
ncbi:MAG: hypothetical protein LBB61_08765 [Treponema sp.]|jgi:hypothetical protein|nr:hypothetical protein [Treponema sp.]